MGSLRTAGFDRAALAGAVEEKRRAEGLSWGAVAEATGVSVSTIKRIATAEVSEADGVIAVAVWLGRTVSEFTKRPVGSPCPLPAVGSGQVARIDLVAVHALLDTRRAERHLTWKAVAEELTEQSGVALSPASLSRFRQGGRTDINTALAVACWLDQPVERFVRLRDG